MKKLDHPLGTIYVPGPRDKLDRLYDLHQRAGIWAADTETTGLNQYKDDFQVRIVQVGTTNEAWILDPRYHLQAIVDMVTRRPTWWHNWVYDGLAMEESLGIDFDDFFRNVEDTDIVSRLVDPRPPMKGGVGHKLKDLGERFVMKGVKDARAQVLAEGKRLFGTRNFNADNMWRDIPIDNEIYLLYAGQDVFLTARLVDPLGDRLRAKGLERFYKFERPLSRRLAQMQRIGVPFDDEWASAAEVEYDEEFSKWEQILIEDYRITPTASGNVHTSATALKNAFLSMGARLDKKTKPSKRYPEGQDSLDKSVLQELWQHKDPDISGLAEATLKAKQNKHYGDYIRGMRDKLGKDGRIHPNIRPMQAATHRMSIGDPPVQQFPRGDARVRGCLVSDEGEVIITADYAQVEFRVGAAVSGDPVMKSRIINGDDLHEVTATALFGAGFTKDQRQASKPIGFGRLYMGSAKGIRQQMVESDTTGYVPGINEIKRAIAAFDKDYRHYKRWALRLKDTVERNDGRHTTSTGRQLIVSPSYAVANYEIQSVARDLFAAGINEIWRRGLGDMLRLVVHDEVVVSAPADEAQEIGAEIADAMATTFKGVPIEVEWEIKGERWAK